MSRSVPVQRLRRLEGAGVVTRGQQGRAVEYRLTDCGMELVDVCMALGAWGRLSPFADIRPARAPSGRAPTLG
ncbi:winged helix-turn-helix transcriptional regulator [Nonomuraea rubra]|uniref:winged helix-turn-helix transcriptional regulator n=1 Tax=Nonomuraea rubra TaxID=46180 RepID=UPI0033D1223A